ncbi:MAG: uroporphyrinogen decarboxylase family protein [Blautia sp.]
MSIDKRAEMMKALRGDKTERLLCSVWRHLPEEKRKGEYVIEDQIRYYRETDVDFLKIMSDGYFPYPLERIPETASEWYQLKPLNDDHPYFVEQLERAERIVKEIGTECMTFYNVFAPFSALRFAATDERIMHDIKENKEAVLHALDVIAHDHGKLAERVITEAGCDGIYFCVQGGEKKRFSHEEYMRLISASDLKVLMYANQFSKWNLLHCCGYDGFKNNLENWKDYPCCAVNWSVHVENTDLKEGKKYFGNKPVIGGFLNTKESMLYQGCDKDIEDLGKQMIAKYNKIPGIILGADCSLPWDIDISKIAKLMHVLHRS